ncbi:MAG: AraC family transcriptional regulator [Opitutaceae bacterium]|nr:AraC family transcriptional regulator [Opitutaceae bacterium]
MKTHFYYLPVSRQNVEWGLYLTAVGTESVPPHYKTYPYATHPSMYYFTWKDGRVLPEYQILYLTRGRMLFESTATPARTIDAGHVIIVCPGMWHRYRPDPATGWEKYWLSANGEDLYRLVKRHILSSQHCILQTGLSDKIRRTYLQILRHVQTLAGDNPHVLAAHVMQLLAEALAADVRHAGPPESFEAQKPKRAQKDPFVSRVLGHIWSHSHRVLTVDELAESLEVSRRTLERRFRAILGKSVLEIITDCRLQRAKHLLQQTALPVDHVAMSAGFPSSAQMTNVFRLYENLTPNQYREHLRRHAVPRA